MSMYSALFGRNELAPLLLKIVNLDQPNGEWNSGRFRDAFLNEDGSHVHVYTRNGGGNRNPHDDCGDGCACSACVMEEIVHHPLYVSDEDDAFDCTYATIVFRVPDNAMEVTKALATGDVPATVSDRFGELFKSLESGENNEQVRRCMEVGADIMARIKEQMDSGESGVIEV